MGWRRAYHGMTLGFQANSMKSVPQPASLDYQTSAKHIAIHNKVAYDVLPTCSAVRGHGRGREFESRRPHTPSKRVAGIPLKRRDSGTAKMKPQFDQRRGSNKSVAAPVDKAGTSRTGPVSGAGTIANLRQPVPIVRGCRDICELTRRGLLPEDWALRDPVPTSQACVR
jgi:hypothetical protein